MTSVSLLSHRIDKIHGRLSNLLSGAEISDGLNMRR